MKKLMLIIAAALVLCSSCATTYVIEGSITDQNKNIYAWKVVDDASTKTAAVTVAYKQKEYGCEVDYTKAADAPPTFSIGIDAADITGSIMVEYKTVKVECKVKDVE